MTTILAFRRKDWLDALTDEQAALLAMQSLEEDPHIVDLISEAPTKQERWQALLEEDLIRTAREEADRIALVLVCAPELFWCDIVE